MNYTALYVCDTTSSAGDNVIIAAPGTGQRICIMSFSIQNESATPTTMILKDGSTDRFRFLGQNQGDSMTWGWGLEQEWRLAENSALNLNLSGANQCGYNVAYFIENVYKS